MPMKLTVTRHRKRSQHHDADSHGISLTVELGQGLLNRPAELQARISGLYREADAALDLQVARPGARPAPPPPPAQQQPRTDRYRGSGNGNGANRRPPHDNSRNSAQMTTAQRRAIDAISQRLDIDAATECQAVLGLEPEQLTVRDASALIDHLKSLEPPAGRNGGRR